MNQLETQVIKIEIGNHKTTNTYIFLGAEEIPQNGAELYCILELPVLNPAALPDCNRIAQAVAASMRRSFLTKVHENSFENALAHINEELQKLASLGQTHWIGKLNAVLAAKVKQTLSVATLGKINAWILRDGSANELTSDNSATTPLRTFENFTSGKLKLDDVLIFSTSELFNYVSLERIKNLLVEYPTPQAAQEIVRILKENAGPEVGFGTIIAQQSLPTPIPAAQPLVESFDPSETVDIPVKTKLKHQIIHHASNIKKLNPARLWRTKLGQTSSWNVKNFFSSHKPTVSQLGTGALKAKDAVSLSAFKSFSTTKKFFLVSAIILLLALVTNLIIVRQNTKPEATPDAFSQGMQQIQNKLSQADTIIIGGDTEAGKAILKEVHVSLSNLPKPEKAEDKEKLATIQSKLTELEAKAEGKQIVNPETIGELSDSQTLIKTTNGFATIAGGKATRWDQATRLTEEQDINLTENPIAHTTVAPGIEFIYTGSSAVLWDTTKSEVTGPFSLTLPALNEFGGLASFPAVSKIYSVNTVTQEINTLVYSNGDLTQPAVWTSSSALKDALSASIDGSVYILTKQNILVYRQGKLASTLALNLSTPLSASAIIHTSDSLKKIYILDRGNNRVLVLSKQAALEKDFTSSEFSNLKDFSIDEKSQMIYVLNGGKLQRFSW